MSAKFDLSRYVVRELNAEQKIWVSKECKKCILGSFRGDETSWDFDVLLGE
jgi:hypothetical protein